MRKLAKNASKIMTIVPGEDQLYCNKGVAAQWFNLDDYKVKNDYSKIRVEGHGILLNLKIANDCVYGMTIGKANTILKPLGFVIKEEEKI